MKLQKTQSESDIIVNNLSKKFKKLKIKKMDTNKLKQHLECSICMEIPVGINVLVCTRGHDICRNCFDRLSRDSRGKKICPAGRCNFAVPPVRNRTVENIIEVSKFVSKCPNASQGCGYRGSGDGISEHVLVCPNRRVDCPEKQHCHSQVYPKDMYTHLKRDHEDNVVFSQKFSVQKWLMRSQSHLNVSKITSWNLVVCAEFGQSFGIRFLKQENLWYTWVVQFGEEEECKNFFCQIKVNLNNNNNNNTKGNKEQNNNSKTHYSYQGAINSVRLTNEEIIKRGTCLSLTNQQVQCCVLDRDISESSRRAGFDLQLPVHYSVYPIAQGPIKKEKIARRSNQSGTNNNSSSVFHLN